MIPTKADALATLVLEVELCLADQIVFNANLLKHPPLSTIRRRRDIITFVLAPLYLVAGFFVGWLSDGTRLGFFPFLETLMGYPVIIGISIVSAFAATALLIWLNRIVGRRRIRALVYRVLRKRPDIDPTDPDLRHYATLTLNEDGVAEKTMLVTALTKWVALDRFDEIATHFFLMSGVSGFIIPKRQLQTAQAELLKAWAATKIV